MSPGLRDLRTPALLLDRRVLLRNLDAMSKRMRRLGVPLRPHMKTAKSADVARLATRNEPGGITVSTLAEAEYFAHEGFRDQTYAVGIVPDKLAAVAELERGGTTVRLISDVPEIAREVAAAGQRLGVTFGTLVEIDSGGGRGGVGPESAELIEIGRILAAGPGSRLDGVLTHAGQSYHCRDAVGLKETAETERRSVVRAADRLREAGLPCPVVSAGSTPTAVFAERLDGVTEMRPGCYMFFDLYQEGLGCCRREEIAISVLATVIARSGRRGGALIDAGALALSLDISAGRWSEEIGYGLVVDETGRPLPGNPCVARVNQEHGFVENTDGADLGLPTGSRVRVLPNHSCITAAMFDRYHVIDGGDRVEAVWSRVRGW